MTGRRAIVLTDGEHYPGVVRAAIESLPEQGIEPVVAVLLGGTEKVDAFGAPVDVGVPAGWLPPGAGPRDDLVGLGQRLTELARAHRAELVVDLSDEPVLDARDRTRLVAVALASGLSYEGADFRFTPPPRPVLTTRPTIAVIGTGKRTGKTAVGAAVTRDLAAVGRTPVIVAMGRGGPPEPVVVSRGAQLGPEALLAIADDGGHAASDFYEDAVTTGAATVGARRCGGGMAGAVAYSNVAAAIARAESLDGDVMLLEGSGAAIPPAHADATVLVVPADCDPEFLRGYLGPFRVLLADLIVVTMAEPPRSSPRQVEAVMEALRSISRSTPILCTVFRPEPLGDVTGARLFFATTAPAAVGAALATSLETRFGCEVVATSSHLADRPALRAALEAAPEFDVLLVELKAAAVDVAARTATQVGARVVFCDNRPVIVDPNRPDQDPGAPGTTLREAVERLLGIAEERFTAR